MSKKNKILTTIFIIGCILIICVVPFVRLVANSNFGDDNLFCNGVTIAGIDMGGMTKDEAQSLLDDYIGEFENTEFIINVSGNTVAASYGAVGFECDADGLIDKAFNVGKKGNLFQRLHEIYTSSDADMQFEPEYTFNEETAEAFVKENCSVYDVKAKNSKLKLKDGSFKATKERVGHEVQIQETVENIKNTVTGNPGSGNVVVEADVETTQPKYTKEMMSKCKDLLGSYTTSYATSTAARASNVETAAGRINGTVLYPGQMFSTIKVIKDRTEANGYQSAPEYSSGKVVDGVGGGVCQVSTTLYNAVLLSELKVVERSPHSMVVGYADVSRDAAISGDYKDFKFKNSTDVPVYIYANAAGGYLTFKIYGEENRASNRTIEYKSEITETIEPGDPVVTVDETKPADYKEVTQSAHVGYKAQLWKIVYVDGVEKNRKLVNTSSYSAEPEYITVGKDSKDVKNSPEPSASANPNSTAKPKATDKADAKNTAKPKSTKKPKQ